jgi:hypothetical protein
MKIVAISMLRYGADTSEAVVLSQATDLTSFGFFQRAG